MLLNYHSQSFPKKGPHECQFPDESCWRMGTRPLFNRSADLLRHYHHVHGVNREEIPCDYLNCTRARVPFTRKDHYRDHLRDFHKEDVSRPKQRPGFSLERWQAVVRVFSTWWRCAKCLDRIKIKDHEWTCPKCKIDCDMERQIPRQRMQERERDMNHEPGLYPQPGSDWGFGTNEFSDHQPEWAIDATSDAHMTF
jgi:hypothetical protein